RSLLDNRQVSINLDARALEYLLRPSKSASGREKSLFFLYAGSLLDEGANLQVTFIYILPSGVTTPERLFWLRSSKDFQLWFLGESNYVQDCGSPQCGL